MYHFDTSDQREKPVYLSYIAQVLEFLRDICTNHSAILNMLHRGQCIYLVTQLLLLLLLLLFGFTVSSTEGLTATCAAAFELS